MFWIGVLFLWMAIGGYLWNGYDLWVCVLLAVIGSVFIRYGDR